MKRAARRLLVAVLVAPGACGAPAASLDGPAAVLYDAALDLCLVSNVGGQPLAKDGDGAIVRVAAAGGPTAWIRGGAGGVTLHAPKGLGVTGDLLWVADIDVLRAFDRRTGEPRGDVPVPGATSLEYVTIDRHGALWCTDSGLDAKQQPTGSDAIWRLAAATWPPPAPPAAVLRGPELGHPRGIVAHGASVYVVNARDGQFFAVDAKGRRTDLARAPAAQLDGLVRVEAAGKAAWFATSRASRCAYRFDAAGGCTDVPGELDQPRGCGYDERRHQLVVALFERHRLHRLTP